MVLTTIWRKNGQFEKAKDSLENAKLINDRDVDIYAERGFLMLDLNNFSNAVEDFTAVISTPRLGAEVHSRSLFGRSFAYEALGELNLALMDAKESARIYPIAATVLRKEKLETKINSLKLKSLSRE